MDKVLELPNPAPKGTEHEKWKAMVDSVIDFIAASRTMLHVLNDRLKESEKLKQDEKKRLEDEKTKLAFYKDYLHVDVPQKKCLKESTTDPMKQEETLSGGGANGDAKLNSHFHRKPKPAKENGDSTECKNRSTHHHNKCKACQNKHEENMPRQVKPKISEEIQSLNPELASKETQYLEIQKAVGKTQTIDDETLLQNVERSAAGSRRIFTHQSGHAVAKFSKISKIPKTRSFSEEKSKSLNPTTPKSGNVIIEQHFNEGTIIEPPAFNKKESTYSHLYRKNKVSTTCAEPK